jgi:hypothetical protein
MAIKSAPYYWLICDECGHSQADDDSDYSAWSDESSAIDAAEGWDWRIDDGRHFCPSCHLAKSCSECGEFKGEPGAACECKEEEEGSC